MTELHLHLDGSLRPESVWEMTQRQGGLPGVESLEDLKPLLSAPENCRDLNEYLRCFDLPLLVLQAPEQVKRAVEELAEDLVSDGVKAAEIRFAPQLHQQKGYTQDEITQAAIDGMREAARRLPGFQGSLILCCMRGADNERENRQTLTTAARFLGHGVCAVDLAGAEALYPTAGFAPLFEQARRLGLPFTIHAGEAAGPESIRAALEFGASRIGHGVRAIEDRELCRQLARQNITLEVCYTSNLQTKAFPDGTAHPLKQLYELGVPVTFSTDNRTVSQTTMTRERQLLKTRLGFTEQELKVMEERAQEGLFC